jgi:hypothetical protein
MRGGVGVRFKVARKQTLIVDGLAKAEILERRTEHIVPVMGTAAKTIQHLVE